MNLGAAILLALLSLPGPRRADEVFFQAHRGGLREVPENTMVAFEHAWKHGAIPEMDLRTSSDGVIILFHDKTPKRTTDVVEELRERPVSGFTFEEIRRWDAGAWFHETYRGTRVPSLEEVFEVMRGKPRRQVYLDLKEVALERLGELIERYEVNRQILFCHNKQESCIRMRKIAPGVRTMLWIGGKPDQIRKKFAAAAKAGFKGLDQVQLHLHPEKDRAPIRYLLPLDFVAEALTVTRKAGIDLEVLPYGFDRGSLNSLLDMGIRWYATDEPRRFAAEVRVWKKGREAVKDR